jgi:sugar-specific transcriptional regulator TrmB
MSKEFYLEKYFFADEKGFSGVNAMSISEITGIPRATVIRKLNRLIKKKFLKKDNKKHYSATGFHQKKILEVQKNTFINFSNFASRIYNLTLIN